MTIKETQWDWELLNDVKALWLRNAKDVTPEEYDKFYHSFTKVIYVQCESFCLDESIFQPLKIDSLHLWVIVFKTEFPGLEC
jgi:hypothetical protein